MNSPVTAALAAALTLCGGGASALTIKAGSAWESASIPVCWENPAPRNRQERDLIRKSLSWTWERESAVRFTGWGVCRAGAPGVHVSLENSHPSAVARGRALDGVARGVRLPLLWSLAALSVNLKAPAHEFGHVLGFGHEYARPDAPEPQRCGLKDKAGGVYLEDDEALTPFDLDTIMVACVEGATAAFSRGVPKLSAADIFGLVRTYGSHPDNALDDDETGDRFGAALLLRDFDGDGDADLAVGAPGDGRGAVYLYRGDAVSGFRPWTRLGAGEAAELAAGFGAGFGWRDEDDALVVHADGAAHLFSVSGRTPEPRGVLPAEGAPPAFPSSFVREGAAAPGFPAGLFSGGRDGPSADHDLDGDGLPDRVIGLPGGDATVPGSGVVVVLRGTPGGGLSPWYWFGQSY